MQTDLIKSKLHEFKSKAAEEIRTVKADVKTFKHEIEDKLALQNVSGAGLNDQKNDVTVFEPKQVKAEIYDYVGGRLQKFNNGFS